jgi:phage terminase large subunit GpA-like protein
MEEILFELSPSSPTEIIALMKAAQIAGSTAAENRILFEVKEDPGPLLYITATDELAREWDEKRLEPLLELSGLAYKLKPATSRSGKRVTGSRAKSKTYQGGGMIYATSYNKTGTLRMQSFRTVIMDEIDSAKHTVSNEGDPRKIAEARTSAYTGRKKILILSTPLLDRTSKIKKAFLEGDQRKYFIPCPFCGHMQILEWRHLKFEVDKYNIIKDNSVYYECQNKKCNEKILNGHKLEILKKGEWRPQNLHAKKNYKSYHLSALYAPVGMVTWFDLCQEFVDAQENPEELQNFVNLRLGETYDDEGGASAPGWQEVIGLRDNYKRGTIPKGVLCVTMACDVQEKDRIEAEICGFGEDGRSWSIDYFVFKGSTENSHSGAFKKLKDFILEKKFPVMPSIILIDAGYNTPAVNEFCRNSNSIFPLMGEKYIKNKMFVEKILTEFGNLRSYRINTDSYKLNLYSKLKLRKDLEDNLPKFYQAFPWDYEDKYFKMLVAEKRIAIIKNGQIINYRWIKKHAGIKNEALDCRVYNYAAIDIYANYICNQYGIEKLDYRFFWKWCKKHIKL